MWIQDEVINKFVHTCGLWLSYTQHSYGPLLPLGMVLLVAYIIILHVYTGMMEVTINSQLARDQIVQWNLSIVITACL